MADAERKGVPWGYGMGWPEAKDLGYTGVFEHLPGQDVATAEKQVGSDITVEIVTIGNHRQRYRRSRLEAYRHRELKEADWHL